MFIVIDGTDGSGKSVQCNELHNHLTQQGYTVDVYDFPRYNQPSCKLVELYLTGVFGDVNEVPPKVASGFFAFDRYQAREQIQESLHKGHIVISNRYVSANMGHQGAKIPNREHRLAFYDWLHKLEYETLGCPRPDMHIFLHMPYQIGEQLVLRKQQRSYLNGEKKDIHEKDPEHLRMAQQAYMDIVDHYDDWITIQCMSDEKETQDISKIKSIDQIAQEISQVVTEYLKSHSSAFLG